MKMNVQTERTELLTGLGQNRSSTAASLTTTTSTSLLSAEDKDSIYTFSDSCNSDNDEADFDYDKFISNHICRVSGMDTTTSSSGGIDKNLNDTRSSTLKEPIRTYSKKSKTASDPKKAPTTPMTPIVSTRLTDINTPSCSPLQSLASQLSPPSDESNSQMLKPNGSAGKISVDLI